MYIRKKILFLLPLLFSFIVFSQDIEEIIIKGEYREKSISEEDSSIVIIQSDKIKSQAIKEIANETGGIYFRATDNKKLEEIYEVINKLEKTEIEEFKYYNYAEKYRTLVLMALSLIILEIGGAPHV